MKKQKKSNKKVKMSTVGIVLIAIGVIGLLGIFSETEDIGSLIIGSLVLLAAGIGLVYIDKKRSKTPSKTSTKVNSTKSLDYIKSLDSVAKTEDSVKSSSVTKKTSTTVSTSSFTPSSTLEQESVIPDGEKDYNLFDDAIDGAILGYKYEKPLRLLDGAFEHIRGNGGKALNFKQEPDNPEDILAVGIYLGENKIGYMERDEILQTMFNSYTSSGRPILGYLNKYSEAKNKATYKIAFYKPFDMFKSKQFTITKIKKKIDEYTTREDNLLNCDVGDVLLIEDDIDGNYIIYNDTYDEVGELPSSADDFINKYVHSRIIGVLDKLNEDDEGNTKANITIYLVK